MNISLRKSAIYLLFTLSIFSLCSRANTSDINRFFNTIEKRIITDSESQVDWNDLLKQIPLHIEKYDFETGSFKDINYKATDQTNWAPLKHILRLLDFTYAYTMKSKGNSYYRNPDVFYMIEKGLMFWGDEQPYSDNWWYNEIGEPQKTALLLLLLRKGTKELNEIVEAKLIDRLATQGDPRKWTGANKTDIALHWLFRACLTKDKDLLHTAVSEGFSPLKFMPFNEGIQPDYSYFQHGVQLYIGGYGDAFLKGVLSFAYYTVRTEYALNNEQLSMIRNFVLNSYFRVIRGSYMHMNVMGRSMSREGATKRSSDFAERMMQIDPEYALQYEAIVRRIKGLDAVSKGVECNNTTYYIGDYVTHIRPSYSVGVRTVSSRTMRSENGNGENHFTYFLSDGSMHFTQNGDEYYNIFPVWDWSRLPGVTNPYYAMDDIPKQAVKWRTRGTQSLVGGASDSLYSVNTYRLDDQYAGINTSANKSWFFFDDEVVCLGSGISSESGLPINTTVEQNRLQGNITICNIANQCQVIEQNQEYHFFDNLKWVLHNNRGYYFPQGGILSLKGEERTGSWYAINDTQSSEEVTDSVFTLWFTHGKKPLNRKYAYVIVPNKNSIEEMQQYGIENIQICENSDSIQAVYHKKLNLLEVVFLKKATLKLNETRISSDKSLTMLVKGLGTDKIMLHIADPTQSKEVIRISVDSPLMSSTTQTILVDFQNSEAYAGKTKVYEIK